MVVWPKAAPGSQSSFTPSPIMDALNDTLSQLNALQAQHNADILIQEETQVNQQRKSKAG
jgi:hypothetical protein